MDHLINYNGVCRAAPGFAESAKKLYLGDRQTTDKLMDIATYRLNRSRGPFSENEAARLAGLRAEVKLVRPLFRTEKLQNCWVHLQQVLPVGTSVGEKGRVGGWESGRVWECGRMGEWGVCYCYFV